jgi:mannose-6-phosphate isomerase-like protein (cupin superfamily)
MTDQPIVVRPQDRVSGDPNAAGGDVYATLATGVQTNDGYYLTHAIVPPGGGPPAHIHSREEEAFFVLSGALVFLAGSDLVEAPAGTFVHVPRGTKHRFRNESQAPAEMIFWFAPAGIEGLFTELAEHPDRLIEIGEKYGVEYFLDE